MTCKDCIHYNSISTLCDKYIYPEERYNEPCDFFNTTCKNCIHFNSTEHPKPEWIGYNKCEKHTADGYQEYVGKDAEICEDYEDKDGLYSDGTWHCPKCGKPVNEWGLCDECRKMYEDMRCINDEERKSWDLLIAKKNHALFQSMLCRQEDNSWESVSE